MRFGPNAAKSAKSSAVDPPLPRHDDEKQFSATKMREIVGSLLYVACMTHPDITCAVQALACVQHNATQAHFTAAKRINRCLKGTIDIVIDYHDNLGLIGFTDADYAGTNSDRRSVSVAIYLCTKVVRFLGAASEKIVWLCQQCSRSMSSSLLVMQDCIVYAFASNVSCCTVSIGEH